MYRKAQQDPSEMIWYLIYLPATFFVFIIISAGVSDQLNGLNQVYDVDKVLFLTGVRYRLSDPDVTTQRATWSVLDYSRVTQQIINDIGQSEKEIGIRLTLVGAACDTLPQFCTFSSDYNQNPSCASATTKADCAFERLRPLIQWRGSLLTTHYAVWNTKATKTSSQRVTVSAEAVFAE